MTTTLRIAAVAILVLASAASCGGRRDDMPKSSPTGGAVSQSTWPPLPTSGFISGRAATEADVKAGNALFVAAVGGKSIGRPLDIQIPQYAIHTDEQRGKKRVIVLQAEQANDLRMVGFLDIETNAYGVGTFSEFELLGTEPNTR